MTFRAVWGFDPDEAIRAQRLNRSGQETQGVEYDYNDERAARIPADVSSQVYELRRIFQL